MKIKNPQKKSTHYNSATFALVHGHMCVLRPVVNKVTVRQDRIWFGKVLIYECHYGGHFLLLVERLVGYPLFYACIHTDTDRHIHIHIHMHRHRHRHRHRQTQAKGNRAAREGGRIESESHESNYGGHFLSSNVLYPLYACRQRERE
jgi:hypothetical protein